MIFEKRCLAANLCIKIGFRDRMSNAGMSKGTKCQKGRNVKRTECQKGRNVKMCNKRPLFNLLTFVLLTFRSFDIPTFYILPPNPKLSTWCFHNLNNLATNTKTKSLQNQILLSIDFKFKQTPNPLISLIRASNCCNHRSTCQLPAVS